MGYYTGRCVWGSNYKKDSLRNPELENAELQNKIFELHKVTRSDYYKSYNYYITQTDIMTVLLDSMIAKAERDRSDLLEKKFKAATSQ